jgi:hypothetical protein
MNRFRIAGACVLVAAVIAAGCSDDGDSNASKKTTTTSGADGSTTTVDTAGTGTTTTTNPDDQYGPNPQPAVGVGVASPLGSDVYATVTKIEPVQLKANGPGDTSGPGVLVSLEVRNGTDRSLDLGGLVINAHYGANVPASAVRTAPNNDPLSGQLAARTSKTGRYAFRIPNGQTGVIVMDVHQVGQPNTVIVDTRV